MLLQTLSPAEAGFEAAFAEVCARASAATDPKVLQGAAEILAQVEAEGGAALLELTARFDGWTPADADALEVPRADWEAAYDRLDPPLREALELAAARIRRFHEAQGEAPVELDDGAGGQVGQRAYPVARAGVYVPGGTARYPSSVLMTAIPARVAGVEEVIMVSPTPGGAPDDALLAAAKVAGVDRVFRLGGAQAIGALAYGAGPVPPVDVIVGPGNVWVAAAKQLVRGRVSVDMEAGPSEVLIVADHSAEPAWVAADLLAQAEHDPAAVCVLITPHPPLLPAVEAALAEQLATLPRAEIAAGALRAQGAAIVCSDLDEALELASRFAAEHLELMIEAPRAALPKVRAAGAVFLGAHTPEALGDYVAGPSHVLPTGGTARFASPLGVHHFMRRMSVLEFSPEGLEAVADAAEALAAAEGLHAHGRAVALRRRGTQ